MTPQEDTPRGAFTVLSWRINAAVIVVLLVLAALAWRSTIEEATSMRGMVMGLGQIGVLAQGTMGAGLFLGMWATMMVAMMLPTLAPMVLAHLAVTRQRGGSALATGAFVGGYLLVWSAIGVVPFAAYLALAQVSDDAAGSLWLPALAGAILMAAGAYQFTGWKRICLDRCQSPFAFVASHDFGGGALSALRAGLAHGAFCLGCCWALTAVLLVVGLMNLLWMAVIFLLFVVEKSWKRGLVTARIAGVVLMALGAAVVARPALLALIAL